MKKINIQICDEEYTVSSTSLSTSSGPELDTTVEMSDEGKEKLFILNLYFLLLFVSGSEAPDLK